MVTGGVVEGEERGGGVVLHLLPALEQHRQEEGKLSGTGGRAWGSDQKGKGEEVGDGGGGGGIAKQDSRPTEDTCLRPPPPPPDAATTTPCGVEPYYPQTHCSTGEHMDILVGRPSVNRR